MRNYIILLFALFPLWGFGDLYAQKQLWGTSKGFVLDYPNFNGYWGGIFKVNLDGTNPEQIHPFDSINGKVPNAKLYLASNGKVYGTTSRGGFSIPDSSISDGCGVLYEYDLIFDSYTVVTYFGDTPQLPTSREPINGVIENLGNLYGTTSGYGSIYKYNLATGTPSFSAQIPNFNSQLLVTFNEIRGELMKASNGMIYGTTKNFSSCPAGAPYLGAIAKLNPTSNAFNIVHPLYCVTTEEGWAPTGGLVEGLPGKLYGTTTLGGINYGALGGAAQYGSGILFEFNIANNAFIKKIDFDINTNGFSPGPLTVGDSGKLYGLLIVAYDPTNAQGDDLVGLLYDYDPVSNSMTVLHNFTWTEANGPLQGTLLKASDGKLYGKHNRGIFKFDPLTNETTTISTLLITEDLIEICRKPSYHFFDVDTFDACVGGTFSYDIQNTNATNYQWLKDGDGVPNQTTGILNLTNLAASDAGNYTCLMTNECGTTTTMVLQLTVNCLGTNTVANLDKAVKLYPNPASDWLNIEMPQNIDVTITSCAVTNLLGQTIYKTMTNNRIDVSQLQNGVYILSLQTNYGKWNGKFIKE